MSMRNGIQILAIANQKGGVGKTNVCFNIAGALAEMGQKVLIVDMDPQVTMSSIFLDNARKTKPSVYHLLDEDPIVDVSQVMKTTHLENIFILPGSAGLRRLDANLADVTDADFFLRDALKEVNDAVHVVLIDCPPNLNRATRMAMVAASGVIAPMQCTEESFQASGVLLDEIESIKKQFNPNLEFLGFVINQYKPRRRIEQDYYDVINEQLKGRVFKTEFRDNTEFAETIAAGKPITSYRSSSEQADLYRKFIKEFI